MNKPSQFLRQQQCVFTFQRNLAIWESCAGSSDMLLRPRSGWRAVLGWSQSELGLPVGLTQRAIHKLEQGETEPRRATMRAVEFIWREQNIEFEEIGDGGFRVSIRPAVIEPWQPNKVRRRRK